MDDLTDLPIFKFSKEIEEAVKDLEFNNDNVCEAIDFIDIKRAMELKKKEQENKFGPDTKIPDKMYPCKCLGPTQDELDEVLKIYWKKIDSKIVDKMDTGTDYVETMDTSLNEELIKAADKAKSLPNNITPKVHATVSTSQSDLSPIFPSFSKNPQSKVDPNKDEPFKPQNDFKTARQEFINDAKKKNQQVPPEFLKEPPRPTERRRLGMRLVPMQNNAVTSPAHKKEETNLEEDDEQLKGIDPKMLDRLKIDVISKPCDTSWDDIKGLEYAKETMMEAIVYPLLRPDLFSGLRRPPKGVLMFGPPGTGKTLIAKCVSNNANATFFNVSASTLTSKWIGESEMMVRTLFTYARVKQPSVVFIDEVDSLLSQRSENENESTRRLKTEFLVFLDGCGTGESDRVLLIGATNRPQELDEAARRRFTKRLYIPLPEKEARQDMITYHLSKNGNNLTDKQIQELAEMTNGYSGADLKVVAEEAGMMPFRDLLKKGGISNIKEEDIPPMEMEHFIRALKKTRPSVSPEDLQQYLEWDQKFGSGGD